MMRNNPIPTLIASKNELSYLNGELRELFTGQVDAEVSEFSEAIENIVYTVNDLLNMMGVDASQETEVTFTSEYGSREEKVVGLVEHMAKIVDCTMGQAWMGPAATSMVEQIKMLSVRVTEKYRGK